MNKVVQLKRKPRPLKKTYQPTAPYVVRRQDHDDGEITYEIYDERPDSYRFICGVSDVPGDGAYAKHDAEQIVRGLNMLVQYGLEKMPTIREILYWSRVDESWSLDHANRGRRFVSV